MILGRVNKRVAFYVTNNIFYGQFFAMPVMWEYYFF